MRRWKRSNAPCARGQIEWRNYSSIGGHEIERARDEFLRELDADPEQIEREYRYAKDREKAAQLEDEAWDLRAGVAELRKQSDEAWCAQEKAGWALAKTKPSTVAGASALLKYAANDIEMGEGGWGRTALKTAAAALDVMALEDEAAIRVFNANAAARITEAAS